MTTKEQDFKEFIAQRNKLSKKKADEKFLKTYTCPVHKVMVRIGLPCPLCKEPEQKKGRHASEEERLRKNELYQNKEYREKVIKRAKELRNKERLRKFGHSI